MQNKPKTPSPTRPGHATPRRSAITTADIARHVGVSPATVSHVLNGRATSLRIRPETQARVLKAIEELGYMPNASARAIRTGRFGTVVLFQSFRNLYLPGGLLQGVTEALEVNDRHLLISTLPDVALQDTTLIPKAARQLLADGLLINALVGIPEEFLEALQANSVPVVWINVRLASDCVHPDDLSGGKMATEHLLSLGHERIVFVRAGGAFAPDEETHYSVRDRRTGYEQAMQASGLVPAYWDLPAIPQGEDNIRTDRRVAEAVALLRRVNRPTALFAYEIETAQPLLIAAGQLGLRIPEDLSLIVCHSHLDSYVGVAITTVEHDMGAVGREAVKMLDEKIQNPEVPLLPRPIPVRLVEGTTCGPPGSGR